MTPARVLVCEDLAELRRLVGDACTRAGHVVVGEAATAVDAATLAARLKPSVVVLDLSSGASPAETIRLVADARPEAAIVAYSGLRAQDVDDEAHALLAAFVPKTAAMSDLVAAIAYATAAAPRSA